MKKTWWIAAALVMTATMAVPPAMAGAGGGPTDWGWFQWMRDADGDGIPNCLDPDWVRPLDGTGYQMHWGAVSTTAPSPDGIQTMLRFRAGYRNGATEGQGVMLRTWLRLRDGSCGK